VPQEAPCPSPFCPPFRPPPLPHLLPSLGSALLPCPQRPTQGVLLSRTTPPARPTHYHYRYHYRYHYHYHYPSFAVTPSRRAAALAAAVHQVWYPPSPTRPPSLFPAPWQEALERVEWYPPPSPLPPCPNPCPLSLPLFLSLPLIFAPALIPVPVPVLIPAGYYTAACRPCTGLLRF